jgi:hypothetical protein
MRLAAKPEELVTRRFDDESSIRRQLSWEIGMELCGRLSGSYRADTRLEQK